ncbi:MAG: hypothetical protein IPM13_16920 [Phycisphaerales bacterium]|nr:hypothetical protein [Phycisphaerales bacterium]
MRHLVERFADRLTSHAAKAPRPDWDLPAALGRELLESMLLARQLDLCAHELRAKGLGHYTICSTGHEANVVLGRLTGPTDPAIVHYRSAAFQLERGRQVPEIDAVRDIVLSLVASSEGADQRRPAQGLRQQAAGGSSQHQHHRLSPAPRPRHWPSPWNARRDWASSCRRESALALASFGDASLNHSTALGALNAASWTLHQKLPLPLLLVCEDNGLGISVRTPEGWVETRLRALPHLAYFRADGWDPRRDPQERPRGRRVLPEDTARRGAPPGRGPPARSRGERRGHDLSLTRGDRGCGRPATRCCAPRST